MQVPTVVIVTRNRRDVLLRTLQRLAELPERPPVVVVDNGSTDGTLAAVRALAPRAAVVALGRNAGAAGRTAGVLRAGTEVVAFSDDDSWWRPGALPAAAAVFEQRPRLGLLAARTLVAESDTDDPINAELAAGPVRGFLACASVVRRCAYLQAGGFHPRYGVGGEERLLALDLRAAGWDLGYAPHVVAVHSPGHCRPRPARRTTTLRNDVWTAWLHYPAGTALRETARLAGAAAGDRTARRAAAQAAAGLPWALTERWARRSAARAAGRRAG